MEEEHISEDVSDRIQQLFAADQADREIFSDPKAIIQNPNIGQEIYNRDQMRRAEAKMILERNTLTNPADLHKMAFLFQHGETADDYRLALQLANQSVEHGWPLEVSLVAAATDRLMIQEQRDQGIPLSETKQKFGTQRFRERTNPFIPPLDGTTTAEERRKYGVNS